MKEPINNPPYFPIKRKQSFKKYRGQAFRVLRGDQAREKDRTGVGGIRLSPKCISQWI